MGSSPTAKIAWAIDFGDGEDEDGFDWEESGIDSYDYEENAMPVLFGFTEEPPVCPDDIKNGTPEGRAWWEANRKPYNERLEAAVPLAFETYGYELGGSALVLKRSLTKVDWGTQEVDPATLAPPTPEEVAAFRLVTADLGFDLSPVKLLLMAEYG